MKNKPLLEVKNLKKLFSVRKGFLESIISYKKEEFIHAVDGVSFNIDYGEVLGLAGESGCGKTTTGMLLALLETPTDGEIIFQGKDISDINKSELKEYRKDVQLIFQDPYESLNPRFKVFDAVCEPLKNFQIGASKSERIKIASNMLEEVELKPAEIFLNKYPHELSGGQRQRVAIARAMILKPKLVIADEPVSMLDASVRVGLMNLMLRLKKEFNTAYLFISHDLAVTRYMCERIGIMYLGVILESGRTKDIISDSRHPYTKLLLSSVPIPDPTYKRRQAETKGEKPSPINLPLGCRFRPRCPYAKKICLQTEPELIEVENGH
jgi:oligopeptide/dipeptide ABC transporter ATP-binding protein